MKTSRKGNTKELRSADLYAERGLVVASRRHVPGPGDLLVAGLGTVVRLVEVKATADGPYKAFGPGDRRAMLDLAERHGFVAELAWWARGADKHQIIPASEWPPC